MTSEAATDTDSNLFSSLGASTARLIRHPGIPELQELTPGDLVICGDEWGVDEFTEDARSQGIHVRSGRYRFESEDVLTERQRRGIELRYSTALNTERLASPGKFFDQDTVAASTDAFAQSWDALSTPITRPTYEPAEQHVPASWVRYLPFPTLNPAQAQTAGRVTQDDSVVVVAPTGAGKTVIGMLAALREITEQHGTAAWLVPQRSLTAELDHELDTWREQGLKVSALSGEARTDARKAREADLLVATTEKFEALCRASSMRDTIAQIGTLVVDEIHLLGDPSRGPLLETLLARIREADSPVRLVGLSATAANATQIADWLNAELVEIAWRPTRHTQQVLTLPSGDRPQEDRWRNAATARITRDVTQDGGSVLVFCGAKANVRSTALAIAHDRGVRTDTVDLADHDAVAEACQRAGVGVHYSDWPHKHAAETAFRDHTIDVLVATSTLAAGVNTPARAVIVRDTSIGPHPMEVSMVQQMFGRAGRAGKESEGWSFLLTTLDEVDKWRERLAAGYTIRSGILNGIEDYLLGEIVQGRVRTHQDAEQWWLSTLAYHQGTESTTAVTAAQDYLKSWKMIEVAEGQNANQQIRPSALGRITSKMMVPVRDAASLLSALSQVPSPRTAAGAETHLVKAIAESVSSVAQGADAPAEEAPAVARLMAAGGDISAVEKTTRQPRERDMGRSKVPGSEVARVAMLLAARSPRALTAPHKQVAGVTRSLFTSALHESPRYLAWLSAVAELRAVPPWVGLVAHDLGYRIGYYRTHPVRGAGRLLWFCERASGGKDTASVVPAFMNRLRDLGVRSPEHLPGTQPSDVNLGVTRDEYAALTRSFITLTTKEKQVTTHPGTSVIEITDNKDDAQWRNVTLTNGEGRASGPVVAFNNQGDRHGSAWLSAFSAVRRWA